MAGNSALISGDSMRRAVGQRLTSENGNYVVEDAIRQQIWFNLYAGRAAHWAFLAQTAKLSFAR